MVRAGYKQSLIPITRELIYGITANSARIEMKQGSQLLFQAQLMIQQFDQPPKTAPIHENPLFKGSEMPGHRQNSCPVEVFKAESPCDRMCNMQVRRAA
jgi:hypothetical protein